MRSLLISLSIFISIIFLFSCGPSNTVEVESFSPAGEVEKVSNFVIEFSEDLAPAEVQDKWLEEEFVTFTPKIPGKFKWASPTTLVFSPDAPLEPMQSYSATINKNVLFKTTFSPDFEEYTFSHTLF
ncbi:MAG: Ig-like domain-containing protein [bacterium]|nr:Ig-like domain-containing protein [bacterium]